MTRGQLAAWKARWKLINEVQIEEAKRLTPDEKLEALVGLMRFALSFPETAYRRNEARVASRRWAKLREAYGDCRSWRPA